MSTMNKFPRICAVCGALHEYTILTSTNTFGSPDLDLRPPQMKRSTMPLWVQECPSCGYAAKEVSDPTQIPREYLQSEAYRNCGGIRFAEPLAGSFYRQYLILLWDQKFTKAFFALLHAAWVCDDADDAENAVRCRDIAAELLEMNILPAEQEKEYLLLYADVLRRAGHFGKLLDKFRDTWLDNEDLRKILIFECVCADKKDAGCHTVEDAVRFYDEICEMTKGRLPTKEN